ncbi:hypothetical protein DFH08DRAFT_675785 [Mycena albidolilacea]|uniref:Uncharacterized protein n=1 Tax=Mycena albidolilacea TaxID=1033008 RepID=A0AAD7AUR1_9AGAR|nr:hypothetical protein DFH08DRAFT_675785 [Mycena albidolilacea]
MEYTPRYTQPFTLSEAKLLDLETITTEIARLQNSLQRLGETQDMLRAHAASVQPGEEVDPEITKAIEENETVIGSQSERISMLKMALLDKGIVAGSHYDLAPPVVAAPAAASPTEDGGVDL